MSTTSHAVSRAETRSHRLPGTVIGLIGLFAVLVVGAVQGGIAMVTDPLTPLGMTTSYLERAPIDTYFWPGIFLLAIAAAGLLTIVGLLFGWRWHWAEGIERSIGFRWPWIGAVATGTILLLFEIIELFMVPFHPVMHPLLIAGSVAIIGLAMTSSARRHLRTNSGDR
jgi:hypothetical protein